METYNMEVPKCALKSIMHIACYNFPTKCALEIAFHIHYSKPVKVLQWVHYGKYCMRILSQSNYSTWLCLVLYSLSIIPLSNIMNLLWYFNWYKIASCLIRTYGFYPFDAHLACVTTLHNTTCQLLLCSSIQVILMLHETSFANMYS